MLRTKFFVLSATLTVAGLLAFAGCSASSSTAWQGEAPTSQPKYEHLWKHQYVYYPHTQVYYDPYNKTWYWKDNTDWQHSAQLPAKFTIFGDRPQIVRMPTDLWNETHYAKSQSWQDQYDYSTSETVASTQTQTQTWREYSESQPQQQWQQSQQQTQQQSQAYSHGLCLPTNRSLSFTGQNMTGRYAVTSFPTQNTTRLAQYQVNQRTQTALVEAQSDAPEK